VIRREKSGIHRQGHFEVPGKYASLLFRVRRVKPGGSIDIPCRSDREVDLLRNVLVKLSPKEFRISVRRTDRVVKVFRLKVKDKK
jgi:hypothetical protein